VKTEKEFNEYYSNIISINIVDINKYKDWYLKYFNFYILPFLPKKKQVKILELGCGWGINLHCLKENGYLNITGVDISQEHLQRAKEFLGIDNLVLQDIIEYLENNNNIYDLILIIDVIEHLEINDAIKLIKLAKLRLTLDGMMVISLPNSFSPFNPNFHRDITHKTSWTPQKISQLLKMANFDNFKIYPLGIVPHGFISSIRYFLWNTIIKNCIRLFLYICYGDDLGGIYTPNILAVVYHNGKKNSSN